MNLLKFFALFISFLITSLALAMPEDEEELFAAYGEDSQEVISIATGHKQLIDKAPAVTTVITQEDIRAIGASDITEVLESVPGLHVSRFTFAFLPTFTFRGIHSDLGPQTLTMIDGVPLTTLSYGDRGRAWTGMPIHNIERIEIIRGPGSALYGADAFSGVINIITKDFNNSKNQAGVKVGSFNTYETWLFQSGHLNDLKTSFSLEYLHTDGHKEEITRDLQSHFDELFGSSASLAPGSINTGKDTLNTRASFNYEDLELRLTYRSDFNVETGAGVFSSLDPNGRQSLRHLIVDLIHRYNQDDSNWNITSRFSLTNLKEDFNFFLSPPESLVSFGGPPKFFQNGVIGNPRYDERHYRGSISAFYSGLSEQVLQFGTGIQILDLYKIGESKNYDSSGNPLGGVLDVSNNQDIVYITPGTRDNYYAFIQDEWSFAPDWQLTAGVRYDYYSDFAGTFNPRAALVWNADYNLTAKLLYGEAFRAVSFSELRVMNNPAIQGNQNINPESIKTIELAFDYDPFEDLNLGLNFFHYEIDDRIDLNFDSNTGKAFVDNIADSTGSGIETELKWQLSDSFRFLGNYAYQKAEDNQSNQNLVGAPNHQFYLRSDWQFAPKWKATGQFNWIGKRKRETGDPRNSLDDYMTFDLNLQYEQTYSPWKINFLVRNLFDEIGKEPAQITIPNDIPLPGRAFFVGLEYNFGLEN